MEKEQILKSIGLSDKEIKIFIASIQLGSSTVNEISRKSKIFRTYCYDVLEKLVEKGIVNYAIKSGVKYYESVDPSTLLKIEQDRLEQLKSVIPHLEDLKKTTTKKPKVEFYEGKEGIKSIHEDIIRTKPDEVLGYGNTTKHDEIMSLYFPRYIKERVENKIKIRVITEKSVAGLKVKAADKKEFRETKFFKNRFDFPTIKYVYGNKIALISLGVNIIGTIIEDKELADSEKYIFDILWDSL
jgi:sugar-specific transcriptional regulator TrmB